MKIKRTLSVCKEIGYSLMSWGCILGIPAMPLYLYSPHREQARIERIDRSACLTKKIEKIVAGEDRIISPVEARKFLDSVGYEKPINEQDRISFFPSGNGALVYMNEHYSMRVDLKTLEKLTSETE